MATLLSTSSDTDLEIIPDAASEEGSPLQNTFSSDGATELSNDVLTSGSTVSSGNAGAGNPYTSGTAAEPIDYTDYFETLVKDSETLVVSCERIQAQNEACISLLAIIIIVGMLNYVYKFFKLFF